MTTGKMERIMSYLAILLVIITGANSQGPTSPTPTVSSERPSTSTNTPQQDTTPDVDCELDMCIVLDDSGSICDQDPVFGEGPCNNWRQAVEFTRDIVDTLNIDDGSARVGMILFSNTARLLWQLDRYNNKVALLNAVDGLLDNYAGGATNTNAALQMARERCFTQVGNSSRARNVMLVITDGVPNPDGLRLAAIAQAQLARRDGIIIYSVGVTNMINEEFLRDISSAPGRKDVTYFTSPTFSTLGSIVDRVSAQTCDRSISSQPTLPEFPDCNQLDIAFVVDSSGSICDSDTTAVREDRVVVDCANWQLVINFIERFIQSMIIGPNNVKVGMVRFADEGYFHWDLNSYLRRSSLLAALRTFAGSYRGGNTYTSAGLHIMRTQVFNVDGDRPGVPNVAVVITDGLPTKNTSQTLPEADAAKASGINIFTIGVTGLIDEASLRDISSEPQQKDLTYFVAPDFTNLIGVLVPILNSSCRASTPPPATSFPGTPLTVGECKVDLLFILDDSGSICDTDPVDTEARPCRNWLDTLEFVKNLISKLNIDDDRTRIGLIKFSNTASSILKVGECKTEETCKAAIDTLQTNYEGGETYTADAMNMAINSTLYFPNGPGLRNIPQVKQAILIITDGIPNPEEQLQPTLDLAVMAQEKFGIIMFAVGITTEIEEDVLKQLSSKPRELDSNYFTSAKFDTLELISNNVALKTCTITSTTTTTTTTTTTRPSNECEKRHIVFILDESGSIGPKNFEKAKSFVSDLLDQLDVDRGVTTFGLVSFATNVKKQFDRCSTTAECKRLVKAMKYGKGLTNTGDALAYVRSNMLLDVTNDVPKVVIVLTDGGSQDKAKTVREAIATKATSTILVLGVGNWLDKYELMSIASDPYQRTLFYAESYDALGGMVGQLTPLLCPGVRVCDSNPCRRGTCYTGINMYTCLCPTPWGGNNCEYECAEPADVVFALDASGSIGNDNFLAIVEFVKNVARMLPLGTSTRIGMLTFGDSSQVYFDLTKYSSRMDIMNALSIPFWSKGSTNTADAIKEMANMFLGSSSAKVGIIVTDGRSNDPDKTWAEARAARQAGITLLAVGIGSNTRVDELEAIASYPQQTNVFRAADFGSLSMVLERIVDTVCHADKACDARPPPCPFGTCMNTRNGHYCVCPPNKSGFSCERNCNGEADILFILDKSGSIRNNRFSDVKSFIVRVIREFEWNEDRIRIAAISFSEECDTSFKLNEYPMRQDQIEAINRIKWVGKRTNIAAALKDAREVIFNQDNGDRANVPNYIIMFSDGGANMNEDEVIPEAVRARIAGAYIVNVAVGLDMNLMALRGIVSDPVDRNVIMVKSFSDLTAETVMKAATRICDDHDECAETTCENGGTCMDGLGQYTCVCQSQNTGRNCERTCAKEYDVVFILDLSTSVDMAYNYSISFIQEVILGLKVRDGTVKVGLVSYGDAPNVVFHLNTYGNSKDMLQALSFFKIGGKTNSQGALKMAKEDMFRAERGDRDNVQNVIIMLTDGGSNVDRTSTIPMANELKADKSARIYVQAVGECINMEEIRAIASVNEEPYVQTIEMPNQVKEKASKLLDHLCI